MTEPRDLWAKAPASLITDPELTDTAVRAYLYIDLRAGRRGYWYGTQAEIAEDISAGHRTVKRAIAQLRDRGLIQTDRTGRERGVLLYRVAARMGHQRPISQQADGPFTAPRRATDGPSAKKHPINHRSSTRSLKRTLTPKTDWDRFMAERSASSDPDAIKEDEAGYEPAAG